MLRWRAWNRGTVTCSTEIFCSSRCLDNDVQRLFLVLHEVPQVFQVKRAASGSVHSVFADGTVDQPRVWFWCFGILKSKYCLSLQLADLIVREQLVLPI